MKKWIPGEITLALVICWLANTCVAGITLQTRGAVVQASNGLIKVMVNLSSGRCDYLDETGKWQIKNASAGFNSIGTDQKYFSDSYTAHKLEEPGLKDEKTALGMAKVFSIRHRKAGAPDMEQIFTLYPGEPFVLVQLRILSDRNMRCNWIAPIVVDSARYEKGTKILEAPYDNDNWRWYMPHALDGSKFAGTSHEFSAIYGADHGGIVMGSITHDFWKTGIDFQIGRQAGVIEKLIVYGGASTDDVCPHGAMEGKRIISSTVFAGFYADIRQGLQRYGQANAAIAPPLPWKQGVPVGWMTFGATGVNYTLPQLEATSDFLRAHLQHAGFCDASGADCIIMDGHRGGFDESHLRRAIAHIHQNGQKAGCYLSPFIYWLSSKHDPMDQKLYGSNVTYADVVLRDERGQPIQHKPDSYSLDVSQPAVLQAIGKQIDDEKRLGFDYFKLDFLTDGLMEGHHADPRIHSGVQAYNQAMRFIAERIGPDKFISLSIAPTFPSQYAHSRRVSCDLYGQLTDHENGFRPFGSTEYLLNCVTYSAWMAGSIYPYNDPDEMSLYRFTDSPPIPETWARNRIMASIVSGGNLVDASDYSDPQAAARARQLLTHREIDAIAREGMAFEPVMDRDAAADLYVRREKNGWLVAVFNFDSNAPREAAIDFKRIGLPPGPVYRAVDLWNKHSLGRSKTMVSVHVAAGDAALLRIDRAE
ncbi:MAG TPA: hypothetical protein VGG19_07455 [Tepidisphaeraceae bacterium]